MFTGVEACSALLLQQGGVIHPNFINILTCNNTQTEVVEAEVVYYNNNKNNKNQPHSFVKSIKVYSVTKSFTVQTITCSFSQSSHV